MAEIYKCKKCGRNAIRDVNGMCIGEKDANGDYTHLECPRVITTQKSDDAAKRYTNTLAMTDVKTPDASPSVSWKREDSPYPQYISDDDSYTSGDDISDYSYTSRDENQSTSYASARFLSAFEERHLAKKASYNRPPTPIIAPTPMRHSRIATRMRL